MDAKAKDCPHSIHRPDFHSVQNSIINNLKLGRKCTGEKFCDLKSSPKTARRTPRTACRTTKRPTRALGTSWVGPSPLGRRTPPPGGKAWHWASATPAGGGHHLKGHRELEAENRQLYTRAHVCRQGEPPGAVVPHSDPEGGGRRRGPGAGTRVCFLRPAQSGSTPILPGSSCCPPVPIFSGTHPGTHPQCGGRGGTRPSQCLPTRPESAARWHVSQASVFL